MIIYLFFIILSLAFFLLKFQNAKKTNHIYIIFFVLLTIVAMLRSYKVGTDTLQYYRNFYFIDKIDWLNFNSLRYEFGFFSLCKLLTFISKDAQILIAVSSLIIIPSVGIFIYKHSKNIYLSLLLYITLNIYFFHLTAMRQSLAITLLLFSYDFFKKKNYKIFFVLIFIASLFHSSAIILLILPLLEKIDYKKNSYYIFIIIGILAFAFYKPLFSIISNVMGKYTGYEGSRYDFSNYFGALFQFLLRFFIYTVCHFTLFSKKSTVSKDSKNLLKFVGIASITQGMAMRMNIIGRISPYFWIFSILLIPEVACNIKTSKNRLFFYVLIISISISYWLILGTFRPEWEGAIPYIPLWDISY